MIGAAQQFTEDNKWVSLMIDSGAATLVCPPWFTTQFPLQRLERGTGPQLRTVANQHIKLNGYRWVCVTNHSGQQIVIPFYVCGVKQPILSVPRLVEQGFQLTLDDNPRLQRTKGFNRKIGEQRWPVLPTSRNHNSGKTKLIAAATNMDEVAVVSGKRPRNS